MSKKVSWKWKGETYYGTLIPSMETKTHRYARTENGKIKSLPKAEKGMMVYKPKFNNGGKPGLWANIHAKRKRGEPPAKPGDKGYPDKKQWNKLTAEKGAMIKPKAYFIGGIVSGIGGLIAGGQQKRAGRAQTAEAEAMRKQFEAGGYELSDSEKNLLQKKSSELQKLQRMDYKDMVGGSLEAREEQRQSNMAQAMSAAGRGGNAATMMQQLLRQQEQVGAQEFANLQKAEAGFQTDVSGKVIQEQQQIAQQEAAMKQQKLQEIMAQKQMGQQMEFEGKQAQLEAGTSLVSSAASAIFPGFGEKGMKVKAGEPELTPGEESHETNPIDLLQGKTKIGEMTGGEVIMPSKDVKKVKEFIDSNNQKALLSLMKRLFTKWEKEAGEHKDKNLKAGKGAKVSKSYDGSKKQTKIKY